MYVLAICFCIGLGLIDSTMQFEDDGRIVGGEPANIQDIPYQLSLRTARNQHFCGASIISANWAVTAAHCVESGTTGLILVAGTSFQSKGGSVHPVIKVISHPSYNDIPINNDIAVLHVRKPFPLRQSGVNCISLASSPPAVGALSQASGWGLMDENADDLPEQLQRVLVPIMDNRECKKAYGSGITEQMICAGYKEGGKDSCSGDSGGPLVLNNKLVGVVSFGAGCATPGYPGVYARVDKLYSWVKQVTGISDC